MPLTIKPAQQRKLAERLAASLGAPTQWTSPAAPAQLLRGQSRSFFGTPRLGAVARRGR